MNRELIGVFARPEALGSFYLLKVVVTVVLVLKHFLLLHLYFDWLDFNLI